MKIYYIDLPRIELFLKLPLCTNKTSLITLNSYQFNGKQFPVVFDTDTVTNGDHTLSQTCRSHVHVYRTYTTGHVMMNLFICQKGERHLGSDNIDGRELFLQILFI